MSGHEWLIASAIMAAVLGLLSWFIKSSLTRQEKNIENVGNDIKAHGETLTEIKLGLRDCVKWADLDKELNPLRCDIKKHSDRLTIVETNCKARHGQ